MKAFPRSFYARPTVEVARASSWPPDRSYNEKGAAPRQPPLSIQPLTLAQAGLKDLLPQTDGLGSYFHQLIVLNVFDGLFQIH